MRPNGAFAKKGVWVVKNFQNQLLGVILIRIDRWSDYRWMNPNQSFYFSE